MNIELTEQEMKDLNSALMHGIASLNEDLKGWLNVAHPDRREMHAYDIFERYIAAMRTLTSLLHKIEDMQEKEKKEVGASETPQGSAR